MNQEEIEQKLQEELKLYDNLWKGGYTEVECAATLRIKEYLTKAIKKNHLVFEIGCGGGFWTPILAKAAKSVHANDIQTAEYNRFWERCPNINNITYHHVSNFKVDYLEDNSIDVVFSYGVLCHVSRTGTREYLKNLRRKITKTGKLILMYADAAKYAKAGGTVKEGPRWDWLGIENFCKMAKDLGYKIVTEDLQIDPRFPITVLEV